MAQAPGRGSEGAWLPGPYQQRLPLLNRDGATFHSEEEIGCGEGCVQVVPRPEWAVRGEEGPGACRSHPSPACRARCPQPPAVCKAAHSWRQAWCPEVLSVFYFGRKVPQSFPWGWGHGILEHRAQRGEGKSSGCAGVGEVICHENCTMLGTPAQFSSRYQRCGSPCQPLLAPLPRGHLGRQAHWGSPKRRPPGNKARDGHKGLLVAQGLGTGEIRPPNKGQGFFLRKWQQSCPWRQQLLELG